MARHNAGSAIGFVRGGGSPAISFAMIAWMASRISVGDFSVCITNSLPFPKSRSIISPKLNNLQRAEASVTPKMLCQRFLHMRSFSWPIFQQLGVASLGFARPVPYRKIALARQHSSPREVIFFIPFHNQRFAG
jgi:hypothetical protein